MIINPSGAKEFWSKKVWVPNKYEAENSGIELLAKLAHKHVIEKDNPSILELCCGKGDFSMKFMHGYDNYSSYQFLDTNADSLEMLVQKLRSEELFDDRIRTQCHYVGENNLKDVLPQTYDVILCARAIIHIPDVNHFFSEVSSQLNADGVFIADIVPDSRRFSLLREKYGMKAYAVEGAYYMGKALASIGIGNKLLTKSGLLRTINPSIDQISSYIHDSGLELVDDLFDPKNHFYGFVAKKV